MNIGDIVAVATFVISILAIAYAFGKMSARLDKAESDINNLGKKVTSKFEQCDHENRELDRKIAELANSFARLDEHCAMLEREETIGRMRG
jgi:hypothetical protein